MGLLCLWFQSVDQEPLPDLTAFVANATFLFSIYFTVNSSICRYLFMNRLRRNNFSSSSVVPIISGKQPLSADGIAAPLVLVDRLIVSLVLVDGACILLLIN